MLNKNNIKINNHALVYYKNSQELPNKYDITLPLADWLLNNDNAVLIQPSDDVSLLKNDITKLNLIVINAANFEDGRIYSQLTQLREKYKYTGEIHIINTHLEHLQFLYRAGASSFEFLDKENVNEAQDYLNKFSINYQHTNNNLIEPVKSSIKEYEQN